MLQWKDAKEKEGMVEQQKGGRTGMNYVLGRSWGQFCRSLEQRPLPNYPALDLAALQPSSPVAPPFSQLPPQGSGHIWGTL